MRGCIRFVYAAYWLMASSFKLLFFSRPSSLFIRKKNCFASWREEMDKSESQSTASPKDTMWVSS